MSKRHLVAFKLEPEVYEFLKQHSGEGSPSEFAREVVYAAFREESLLDKLGAINSNLITGIKQVLLVSGAPREKVEKWLGENLKGLYE